MKAGAMVSACCGEYNSYKGQEIVHPAIAVCMWRQLMLSARLILPIVTALSLVWVAAIQAKDEGGKVQKAKSFEKEITVKVKLNYLLFLPEGYDQADKRWPLVLFLHGSGESGSDLEKVKIHGPPKIVETKKDFPFILVSPQCPSPRVGWDPATLKALLDDVLANYKVDPERIYLTGLSMGGYGSWRLAAFAPNRFAAVVPICGGGNPADAPRIKHVPIWVFHGAKDKTVPLKNSQEMVDALKAAGADVKFTVYPEAGHDSWTATYDNPELWEWLLKQKRHRGD
jgi:predicted peptidase